MAIAIASGDPTSVARDADELMRIGAHKRGTVIPAWVLAASGRQTEAVTLLEASLRSEQHFPDVLWAGGACVLLENSDLGARVYPALAAEVGTNRVYWGPGGGTLFGPTSLVAADLALLLGRREEASAHYDDAIALCRTMGAKPFLALALKGREACGTLLPPAPSASPRDELSLRREGELWVIKMGKSVVRLKNGKGLSYLEQLVLHAGRELHVLVLVGAEHADGDAGAILDARAKAEYQERIQQLDDRIELARSLGDERAVDRARAELDAVAEHLRRGGPWRPRPSRFVERRASPHQRPAAPEGHHCGHFCSGRCTRTLSAGCHQNGHLLLVHSALGPILKSGVVKRGATRQGSQRAGLFEVFAVRAEVVPDHG